MNILKKLFITAVIFSVLYAGYSLISKLEIGIISNEDQQTESDSIEKLASIGYMGGYRPPEKENEKPLDEKSAKKASSHTFITSGHAPIAYLLDPTGKTIHTWQKEFNQIFPQEKISQNKSKQKLTSFWRHATLLPDGDILAIFEGLATVKLNKKSRVIWAKLNNAHHDLEVQKNGNIYVLTRKIEKISSNNVLVDYVTLLDPNGEVLESTSIVDAILNSPFKDKILAGKNIRSDLLHTNSLEILNETTAGLFPNAKSGDVLLSLRNVDHVVILRPSTKTIIWAHKDIYKQQHYAKVIPDKKELILFDNFGAGTTSRILKYSLPDLKLVSNIGHHQIGRPFYSRTLGIALELPNGNILTAESEGGKLYELTPEGKPTWRYINPHRTGEKNRFIATIPHVQIVTEDLAASVSK